MDDLSRVVLWDLFLLVIAKGRRPCGNLSHRSGHGNLITEAA